MRRQLALFALEVSLTVDNGILVLFGPSGAGKSMLLRTIAGIERADAGIIELGGRVLLDTSRGINLDSRQRRVGYVPQQYGLFPHLSAVDNVAYPMVAGRGARRAEARARARELLDMVGVANRADAPPSRLSGGQQQRVAIARAVGADSEVLLLDEPLAALDAPTRHELRELLRRLQRELAVPVIFVTRSRGGCVSRNGDGGDGGRSGAPDRHRRSCPGCAR
ncbi:MAG: ATP-binding cassette domain-containing protein [Thermomicrobiales bacterium]|nr:ATP-binding cassette domain-containing protein [Thermomicrobiales bacterium]